MVDRDHGVGVIDAAPVRLRQSVVLLDPVATRQHEQFVVAVLVSFGSVSAAGWSASSSSVSIARLRSTRSVLVVVTSMPSSQGRTHAAASTRAADVDHAHAAHADRVVALVVA